MRILLVDDEPTLRMTLVANLELEGFEVVEAENGEQALRILGEQDFDLVLTDIRMPGMNGVEMFQRMRSSRPDVPVILMTGFALETLIDEAIRSGAFTVLSKPFPVEQLLATLTRALQRPVVLVVDDAESEAETTAASLREMGVRAEAVLDAESALGLLQRKAVDVCIVDLVMPGVSGPELIQRIRDLDPAMSFIAVSGHDVPEMMSRVAQSGAFACLQKPVAPSSLVRSIAKARGQA